MQIPSDVKAEIIAVAKEFLKDHHNEWADHWDSVMVNDDDGYDINIWQEGVDEPLFVSVYEVKDNNIIYENTLDITEGVV